MAEYFTFTRKTAQDFKSVILPGAFESIIVDESIDEESLILVGAVENDKCIGATVCVVFEGPRVDIISIFVSEQFRGMGIGSEMLKRVISLSKKFLDTDQMSLYIEYTLEAERVERFNRFLEKNRFNKFVTGEKIYSISSEVLKNTDFFADAFSSDYTVPDDIGCIADEDKEISFGFKNYCSSFGMDCILQYSFYSLKDSATDEIPVVLSSRVGKNAYELCFNNCTFDTFKALTNVVIHSLFKDKNKFVLILNSNYCGDEESWSGCFKDTVPDFDTGISIHCEAGLFGRIIFDD